MIDYEIKLVNQEHSRSLDLTDLLDERLEVVIGRAENCDIKLSNDFVSRKHCLIRYHAPDPHCVLPDFINRKYLLSIKDLGSLNGTFVNNSRIKGDNTTTIGEGDRITIGGLDYYVTIANKIKYQSDIDTKEIR